MLGNRIKAKPIKSSFKNSASSLKWGNGVFTKKDLPIIYFYGMKKGVQLGFFAGALVKDPKGLLKGSGKSVRHIPVLTKEDIDEKYFATMIRKAIKIKYR